MREERGRGREGGRGRRSAGRGMREEPRREGGEIVTQKGQAVFEQLCVCLLDIFVACLWIGVRISPARSAKEDTVDAQARRQERCHYPCNRTSGFAHETLIVFHTGKCKHAFAT